MAVHQLPKLRMRVRFPSSAPRQSPWSPPGEATRIKSNDGPQLVTVPSTCPEAVPKPLLAVSIRSRESAIARSRAAVACW